MSFVKYPNYKDSGVEWIGEIPVDGDIVKIKRLRILSTSSVDKKSVEGDKKVKLVNYLDVYISKTKEIVNNINFMNVAAKPQQILNNNLVIGDVLFRPSSKISEDIGHSAVVFEDLKNTLHSYHLIRLRFNENFDINLDFKKYLFNNILF